MYFFSDIVYVTDHAYDEDEVVDMERSLLAVLGGLPTSLPCTLVAASTPLSRSQPTTLDFLIRYVAVSECNMLIAERARYLVERSFLQVDTCALKTSLVAAVCLHLAMKQADHKTWSRKLHGFTGYSLPSLLPLAAQMTSFVEPVSTVASSSVAPCRYKSTCI